MFVGVIALAIVLTGYLLNWLSRIEEHACPWVLRNRHRPAHREESFPHSVWFFSSIIGDAAAAFWAMLGITLAGGTPLGALLHYLIGPAFGALFGAAVSRLAVLRPDTPIKAVGLGVLYVELISQPLLAAAAWVLRMTAAETAQWFGISFVMHLVYGLVLGLVAYYGLRGISPARQA